MWQGVRQLSPGYLISSSNSAGSTLIRIANYPSPSVELKTTTSQFCFELNRRLTRLLNDVDRVSTDLSGGLDSSFTTAVLSRCGKKLQTVFLDGGQGNINDKHWASLIASGLSSNHVVLDYLNHSSVLKLESGKIRERMDFGFDESFRYCALAQSLKDLAARFGSPLHFNGHGGDELFGPNSAMAWSYLRYGQGSKLIRLKNVFGYAAANKFPRLDFGKALYNDLPFQTELEGFFQTSLDMKIGSEKYDTRWLPTAGVLPYSTEGFHSALDSALETLIAESRTPYSEDRAQHRITEDVVAHVSLIRALNSFQLGKGDLRFTSIFLSPPIISAAMSLSADDRFLAHVAKPLLYHA